MIDPTSTMADMTRDAAIMRLNAKNAELEQTLRYARDDQRTAMIVGFVAGIVAGVILAASTGIS